MGNQLQHYVPQFMLRRFGKGKKEHVHVLDKQSGLDMADWWEPTAEGFLSHVSKAQIVQALKEAGTDPSEDGIGDMKKAVLVVEAASRLAGKRWLPAPLRRPPG